MTKEALLVVSHGSRRPQSNAEVVALSKKIKPLTKQKFDLVEAAFLELADPLIPDGIKRCVEAGVDSVLILPYFLAAGRHVVEDIPGIVEQARQEHPGIEIRIMNHVGAATLMPDFLAEIALAD